MYLYKSLFSINKLNQNLVSFACSHCVGGLETCGGYRIDFTRVTNRLGFVSKRPWTNCTTQGSITTLLHLFWNSPITGFGQFKYFIDVVLSWFEIKFIHFWGEDKSFGNKSCKICHMILFVFHFPAIWLVTLNKPWNLIGCSVFSVVLISWEKDAI